MAPALHNRSSWTFLLYFFYLFAGVGCLKCLQCSFADPGCLLGTSPAKECPSKSHVSCITFSGYMKESSSLRLFRNCTQNTLATRCVNYPVNDTEVSQNAAEMKVCFYTCRTDGCNTDVHGQATNTHCVSQLMILISFLFVCTTSFLY